MVVVQVADRNGSNVIGKWRWASLRRWHLSRSPPCSSLGEGHSRQSTARALWQECAHKSQCGRRSARGSVRKMRSESRELSGCEADCAVPHGPLSVLWNVLEIYFNFSKRWGVMRGFKQSAFQGSPLAAVLGVGCVRARLKQTSLQAAVVTESRKYSNLGHALAVERLRYVFLT